ncbi:MAG: hypothetical protein ABI193_07880 [Minicystis sp.]
MATPKNKPVAKTKKKNPLQPISPAKKPGKAAQPFLTTDRETAFAHFSALVQATPPEVVEAWHYDAEILRVNADRCLEALRPHLPAIAKKMPYIDLDEVREIPSLALALAFADTRVFTPASAQQIKEAQLRQRPKRRLALAQLTILKDMNLIADTSKVDAIVPGRGAIDEAQDGVACVAVFGENAAKIAGKHPFDEAWLASLAEDSNWLLTQLKPKGAKMDKMGKSADALVRDQLYTELVRRYGQAKKVAVEIWGWKGVDAQFPALGSRESNRSDTGSEAPSAPEQKPAQPS